MHDPDSRGHHLECLKSLHAPFEEFIPLPIPLELHLQILVQRTGGSRIIDLHGVVHHQIHRHQRFDHFGIFAQTRHRRTHRRQIHQQRHSREVLQDNARHHKRNLLGPR